MFFCCAKLSKLATVRCHQDFHTPEWQILLQLCGNMGGVIYCCIQRQIYHSRVWEKSVTNPIGDLTELKNLYLLFFSYKWQMLFRRTHHEPSMTDILPLMCTSMILPAVCKEISLFCGGFEVNCVVSKTQNTFHYKR